LVRKGVFGQSMLAPFPALEWEIWRACSFMVSWFDFREPETTNIERWFGRLCSRKFDANKYNENPSPFAIRFATPVNQRVIL